MILYSAFNTPLYATSPLLEPLLHDEFEVVPHKEKAQYTSGILVHCWEISYKVQLAE